jgi:glycerophosphoryl diester phosphodiesterase
VDEVAVAHKAGLQVIPYTSNTVEGWKKLSEARADGIITDDPAGLLQWLHSQKPALHR